MTIISLLLIIGCGSDSGTNNNDNGNSDDYTASLDIQLIATDLANTYYIQTPLFAPDGDGGFYFMDDENHVDAQTIYHLGAGGAVTDVEITPSKVAAALGYDGASGDFIDIGCDANDWVYFLFYFVYDSENYMYIMRANPGTESLQIWASNSQIQYIFGQAGFGGAFFHIPLLRSQIMVRPDGTLWLYTNDEDRHVMIYLYYQADELMYMWWLIPTPTEDPNRTPKVGLSADGDFFMTDIDAGVVWRGDINIGVSPFINLEGFPNTTSGIAEDSSGALHFATNYVLDYDISILETGYGGDATMLTTCFAHSVDWLLYAPRIGDEYHLFGWESTALTDSLGREGVPGFWRFMLDPVSGTVYTMDTSPGDIYRLRYTVE